MTKLEVQARVLQNGKPLDLDKFTWDEKTKTFLSAEDGLVLDFKGISDCTFKTGPNCSFNTGSNCTFNTGWNCTFNTGFDCTFKTGWNCTFNTGFDCTFNTGLACTFKTESNCTFKTGSCCTFKTGSNCTFKTGFDCTFKTGSECVVVRRDIFEVIMLEEGKPIKLNGWEVPGYTYVKPVETIEIAGIKYNKAEFEEAVKDLRRVG